MSKYDEYARIVSFERSIDILKDMIKEQDARIKTLENERDSPTEPLPQPKEEKAYILTFEVLGGKNILHQESFDLTEPAAQAVAEAIKALLEYVNTTPEDSYGNTGMLTDKAYLAYQAVQGDKDE